MQMYRNYDGAKSGFGDTSVSAVVPNPDLISAFAAERAADGALTVMVINKQSSTSAPVSLSLANFTAAGSAHVYRLTANNVIQHLADKPWSAAALTDTEPAQSITLYVLPK
jgi:alpha-L-arabinofuranosidase